MVGRLRNEEVDEQKSRQVEKCYSSDPSSNPQVAHFTQGDGKSERGYVKSNLAFLRPPRGEIKGSFYETTSMTSFFSLFSPSCHSPSNYHTSMNSIPLLALTN